MLSTETGGGFPFSGALTEALKVRFGFLFFANVAPRVSVSAQPASDQVPAPSPRSDHRLCCEGTAGSVTSGPAPSAPGRRVRALYAARGRFPRPLLPAHYPRAGPPRVAMGPPPFPAADHQLSAAGQWRGLCGRLSHSFSAHPPQPRPRAGPARLSIGAPGSPSQTRGPRARGGEARGADEGAASVRGAPPALSPPRPGDLSRGRAGDPRVSSPLRGERGCAHRPQARPGVGLCPVASRPPGDRDVTRAHLSAGPARRPRAARPGAPAPRRRHASRLCRSGGSGEKAATARRDSAERESALLRAPRTHPRRPPPRPAPPRGLHRRPLPLETSSPSPETPPQGDLPPAPRALPMEAPPPEDLPPPRELSSPSPETPPHRDSLPPRPLTREAPALGPRGPPEPSHNSEVAWGSTRCSRGLGVGGRAEKVGRRGCGGDLPKLAEADGSEKVFALLTFPAPARPCSRAAADAAAAPAAAAGTAALLVRARGAPASPRGWDPGPTDRRPCPPGGGGSGLAESLPSQEGTLWGF